MAKIRSQASFQNLTDWSNKCSGIYGTSQSNKLDTRPKRYNLESIGTDLAATERTVPKASATAKIGNKLGRIKTGRSGDRTDHVRPLDLLVLEPFEPLWELGETIVTTIGRRGPFRFIIKDPGTTLSHYHHIGPKDDRLRQDKEKKRN